jgi:hypothetical protein
VLHEPVDPQHVGHEEGAAERGVDRLMTEAESDDLVRKIQAL